mgnify:CR=1 FL=1
MAEVKVVDDVRGVLVKVGLGQPSARAFCIGAIAAGLAYLGGFPKTSFREDGSMKPLKYLSPEPDATTTHFLLVPLIAATAGYLCT